MLRNGVRLLATVALISVTACQAPVGDGSIYAPAEEAAPGDQRIASREAARPVVNVPPGPPAEAPGEPRESGSSPPATRVRTVARFTYDSAPLADVINDIRQLGGVNIVVNWRSLADHNITRQTPISIDLTGVSFSTLLDVLTDDLSGGRDKLASVYWLVDDGIVRIATGSALNTTLQTRVYNIGDLLMLVPDFEGPRLNLDTSEQLYDRSDDPDEEALSRAEAQEQLIELVKDTIGQDMWQPAGEGSVSIRGEQIIITQTPLGWLLMRTK